MARKDLIEAAADAFVDSFRKSAAHAVAAAARTVERRVGEVVKDFEREAACSCSPVLVEMPSGKKRLVHESECAASKP